MSVFVEMHRQPHGWSVLYRPRHPMPHMSRDEDVVAGTKCAFVLALQPQARRASKQKDPLVAILIVGLVWRSGLSVRHDALDPHAISVEDVRKDFLVEVAGQVGYQVHGLPSLTQT